MEVTKNNFDEFYEEFKEELPKADYYAIDFEMTGIKTREPEMVSDLPFERYSKLRDAANKYRIIQVGICLFTKVSDKEIQARPYNIYIFPREYEYSSPHISIDVSAAEFNTNHGMDWTKWFSQGVTYMTLKSEKKRRTELNRADKKNKYDESPVKLTRQDDIEKSKKFIEDLKAWLASGSKETHIVQESSSFMRRHYYDILREEYKYLKSETLSIGEGLSDKAIHIHNLSNETDKKAFEEEKAKEKEKAFSKHVGFTNIFKLLVESKKPLIGHNCYFDLLFFYSHFINKLPQKFETFKKNLHQSFPEIYDTKYIFQNTKFRAKVSGSTSLCNLIPICSNKEDKDFYDAEIKLGGKFKAYEIGNLENPRYHEAGYDAFVTGLVFTRMFFGLDKQEQEKLKNSVNVMKSLYSLKIDGEDPMYKKTLLFILRSTDKKVKLLSKDILAHFEDPVLCESIKIIQLALPGLTGAMINFDSKEDDEVEKFVKSVEALKSDAVEVLTYEDFIELRREAHEKGIEITAQDDESD